jgi:hypothetical protein
MMRAMLLALCACAPPSAFAFVASARPFSARGSARGVTQSKRSPDVVCALNFDPDRMRDLKTIDNAIYSIYDIVFKNSLPPYVKQDEVRCTAPLHGGVGGGGGRALCCAKTAVMNTSIW